jgi:predicted membrane protein
MVAASIILFLIVLAVCFAFGYYFLTFSYVCFYNLRMLDLKKNNSKIESNSRPKLVKEEAQENENLDVIEIG